MRGVSRCSLSLSLPLTPPKPQHLKALYHIYRSAAFVLLTERDWGLCYNSYFLSPYFSTFYMCVFEKSSNILLWPKNHGNHFGSRKSLDAKGGAGWDGVVCVERRSLRAASSTWWFLTACWCFSEGWLLSWCAVKWNAINTDGLRRNICQNGINNNTRSPHTLGHTHRGLHTCTCPTAAGPFLTLIPGPPSEPTHNSLDTTWRQWGELGIICPLSEVPEAYKVSQWYKGTSFGDEHKL